MTHDKKPMDFNGKGFDKSEFSPEERSEIRHRANHYDNNFLSTDQFLKETGLTWLAAVGKGAPAFIKFAVVFGSIGGAILIAKKLGVI